MDLKYAIKEYKKAKTDRMAAQRREERYRQEILKHCPYDTQVGGIKVAWYMGTKLDQEWMRRDGIDLDHYRVSTGWIGKVTLTLG